MGRGYRGTSQVKGPKIEIPKPFNKSFKWQSATTIYIKNGFKRRAAIEPRIGHLKQDHRLSRNYYKGIKGDHINVMLAAAAMNFKRMMNICKRIFLAFLFRLLKILFIPLFPQNLYLLSAKLVLKGRLIIANSSASLYIFISCNKAGASLVLTVKGFLLICPIST